MSCRCVDSAQLNGLVSCAFIPDEAPHLGSFDKEDTQGELKKNPSLSCPLCCCYPTFFKNRCLLHLCLPPLCSWYFQPPLWVLWDFYCSVKSAAALMARPSRAVIQTSKLLGHKSCPEFALAGSSSRGRRDYLFIWNLSGHGCLLSAGDYKIQTFNLCGTH